MEESSVEMDYDTRFEPESLDRKESHGIEHDTAPCPRNQRTTQARPHIQNAAPHAGDFMRDQLDGHAGSWR
jgi:hypothetical protein